MSSALAFASAAANFAPPQPSPLALSALASPPAAVPPSAPWSSPSTSGALCAGALAGVLAAAAGAARRSRGGARAKASGRGAAATACRANPIASFETTMGTFKAELFLDKMPITCSSFIDLCKTGFYDGIHFHRVIPNFMNQFGCPNAKDPKSPRAGTGGPPGGSTFEVLDGSGRTIARDMGGNIPDELIDKSGNTPGTLSMANTGQPNSGGSQLFINVTNNSFLNWFDNSTPSKHPVFGCVTDNYELVEKISKVRTNRDAPVEPIMMKTITIEGI